MVNFEEGQCCVVSKGTRLKEGSDQRLPDKCLVVWHRPPPLSPSVMSVDIQSTTTKRDNNDLLAVGGEEERTCVDRFPRQPLIVQPPTIGITVCLVGVWTINANLKRRRRVILWAQEEERMKRREWSRNM